MSQFTAPDGSVYNIPTEPNKRRLFTKAIKDTYGVDVDKTTVLQRAAEIPKGIARGATLLATDVPLGISALFDVGDDGAITKGLQDFQKRVRETSPLAAKPGYEDLWTTKLAEGVGSFVPFLGAAKVGQVLTKTPQKLFTKEYFKSPAFTVPGALGVTSGMAQQADRIEMARQLGENVGPVAETLATVTGGTIGVSEVLPVAAILNKLSKGALLDEVMGNKIKRALVSGTQEGAQEVFASIAQDATARGFYSDELPIGESILDEFTIGATIGAGADLILNSFAGRRGLANQRFKDEEQAARENNRIAQENKKAEFELAQQQGDLEVLQPRVSKETPDVPVPPITTTVPTLSVIQTPDGKYSLIDPTNTTQPVLRVFDTEAKALTSKKREQNKLFREKNLSELTNDLYNLGLINSSSGLAMGNTIKDTNNQFVNAKSIIDFDSKVNPKKLKSKDDYFKNKNVDVKDAYTFAEVRKILNAKDLNLLLRDKASQVFAASEKAGEPSIRDDKKLVNVNNKAIKDLAASKNIELDFTDPAVRYFSRQLTGFDDIAKVKNRGAKELFVARLHSLPKFNVKTKFPDFRPRNYTAQDMADFVANYKTDNIKFDVGSLLKAGPDPIRKNKVATEQFVRDLVNSGRAEKIEGTNNYQIRDNFEFDIARRAEGFNETPEEFGARLKSEGVLPDETIIQLQEAEQVRQERFLPPEEVAPKMINFAEAVEEGKVNKFAKEAQKVLDGVGLGEVGLVISDDILSTTALRRRDDTFAFDPEGVTPGTKRVRGEVAEYDRNTDTIFISLSAINPDGTLSEVEIQQRINRVINHELIHALRAKDLITEKDYTYLAKEVKRRKVPASVDPSAAERGITYYTRAAESYSNLVDRATPEQREDLFVEEAIAELYKNKDSKPDIPPKAKTILGKITQFFESLGQAFKRSGFNRASEILQDIEAGKVGARERGVLRSVKDVFRPERAGIPTFARGPRDESSGHLADYVPAQYGPPAHNLNAKPSEEEFTPEGYSIFSTTVDYNKLQDFSTQRGNLTIINRIIDSAPTRKEGLKIIKENPNYQNMLFGLAEEVDFLRKLQEIKGNPNAEITMYQAAPQRDLREGDLITPFLSEANLLVEDSKITKEEIREADRARRRQEQIDKTGAVNLQQEKNFAAMDEIMDMFGMPERTPSRVHTFKLRAGDVRWDGNNGWARWGYFPRIKAVEDIPTFSRDADDAYFANERKKRRLSNLKEQLVFREAELNEVGSQMTDNTRTNLEKQISNIKDRITEIESDIPTFSKGARYSKRKFSDFYYHITPTPNVRGILQSSINPLKPSNFINARTGNRFQDEPAVFAFTNPIDAIQWWSNTEFNREDLSMLLIDKNANDWTQDPASMSFKGNIKEDFRLVNSDVFGFGFNEQPTSVITTQPVQAKDIKGSLTLPDLFGKLGEMYGTVSGIDNTTPYYGLLPTRVDGKEEQITYMNRVAEALNPVSAKDKRLLNNLDKAEEYAKSTRKFQVPTYNTNASDVALDAAIEFNEDGTPKEPDIPTFSVGEMPQELQASARRIMGAYDAPTEPYGVRLIELVSDPITNVRKLFKNARQLYIDKYDKIARKSIQLSEDNDAIRLLNNTADTSAIAAIRMSDRARGIFQGLLTTGYATDLVDGETGLINVLPLELSAEYNTFLQPETQDTQDVSGRVVKEAGKYYGGLTQILAPVYTNSSVDGEQIFKLYGILKRAKKIDETTGKETPVTADDLAKIPYIESNFPEIVEAYNNYQRWNNQLIELAKNKGLLSEAQATQWQDYSAYYPFYRNMVEDGSILGPSIGGGALPTNPLGVKMKGSVEAIDTNPVEAIARNSLSILNAAMKNDGMQKLMRDLQLNGEAELVDVKQASRPDVVPVFVDGEKVYYRVDDLELVESMQGMGVTSLSGLSKFLAMPASFLRDVVTRDPGFVVVNLLRDTLSASVTSGVPINSEEGGFKPVITTVRNMFRDMTDLERFGVLGGYDFQNDEGSVKQFVDRAIRKEGINPDNSMSMSNLFYKAWDGLGALTTKSDGATRLGVFDAVYKDIKERGGTEAQAQSEAAYQGLEIINFGRRGSDPLFRTITAAIPFLNARIQGLDVLYRSFGTGEYSAIQKLEAASPEAAAKLKQDIFYTAMSRGMFITFLTLLYYLMVSDDEEYQNIRREVRDDNWIIPLGNDIPAVKIPIPFEVGMVFKAIPERTFDLAMGETSLSEYSKSLRRQLGTSANIPFFDGSVAFQVIKPIADVVANRNSFTGTDIVPYYQTKLEPAYQQRATTNELARVIGETFNISPIKLEYIVRGYTGTLGGYLLDAADSVTRLGTGTPYIPPNINSVPVVKRFLLDLDKGGGLQQQFYDLRNEVDRAVQTMNKLKKSGRFDELQAYRTNMQGVLNVKGQIRAIERYMDNWRKRRDVLLARTDINPLVKAELLEQLEMERDKRLSIITELKKKANVPAYQMGL